MSEGRWPVPAQWEWAEAKEIADVVGGGTPDTSNEENFATTGVPWLTPADLSGYKESHIARGRRDISPQGLASSGARMMPAGTVLFSSRAPVGYCVIATNEISTNQGFKSLVLRDNLVPEFIRYYLLSAKEYAESLASGTTFKELSGARMQELQIPVGPIPEQRRIVAKLDALFERSRKAKESLDRIPALLERLRQSILAAAFRGDLTKEWREAHPDVEPASVLLERMRVERRREWEEGLRAKKKDPAKATYEEPASVDTANLPELPIGWSWTTLATLCEFVTSGSRGWGEYYSEAGDLFLRVGNLDHNRIALDLTDVVRVTPPQGAEGERTRVAPGDILISITADVGMVGLVPEGLGQAYVNQHIAMCRPHTEVSSEFLAFALLFPLGAQKNMRDVQYGVTKASLSLLQVRDLPVPFPPAAEQAELQQRIRSSLAKASRLEDGVESMRSRIGPSESALLAKAFRGELVPQDPNDEPASVLLERIRAERAAAEETERPRKRRKAG